MKEQINKVLVFNEAFNLPIGDKPKVIFEKDYNLQYELAQEELNEYLIACKENDLVGITDSLGDRLYVLFGTIIKHGLQYKIEEVFNEIQRSNMSKLGNDGKPIGIFLY